MRQIRYPLFLDTDYPPERLLFATISSIPSGERAGFLRVLTLLGQKQLERTADNNKLPAGEQGNNGTD